MTGDPDPEDPSNRLYYFFTGIRTFDPFSAEYLARVIEFTNRGDMAYPAFTGLVRHFAKADPAVILGVGSAIDAPTAALFLAAGANFIVGPNQPRSKWDPSSSPRPP